MKRPKIRELLHDASAAHCDLNIFYAIIALTENGLLSSNHESGVRRINTICKAESQKALRRHDKARAKIEARALTGEK